MNNRGFITDADNGRIDIFELWPIFSQYKWLIFAPAILCFALAGGLALLMTPKYQAEVLLATADEEKGGASGALGSLGGQLGGLAEMAGISIGGGSNAREIALAYIRSRAFIERFINEKNLLPALFPKQWDPKKEKWHDDDPKLNPTTLSGYRLFSKMLTVNSDKKTGLITLKLEWRDRKQVVEWANDIVRRVNADLRQRAIQENQQSLIYLEKELQKTSVVEVQQAIYRLMEGQVKTMMLANTREQFAFKIIDPAAEVGEDEFIKPKPIPMMVIGIFVGLGLGVALAFIVNTVRNSRREKSPLVN